MDRKTAGAGMIRKSTEPRRGSSAKITAQLEFTPTGYLKTIFLNAESDVDQAKLEQAMTRLMNPRHLAWIMRLFRRP